MPSRRLQNYGSQFDLSIKGEKELCRLLDAQPHGTPASRVNRLTTLNVSVDHRERKSSELPSLFAANIPLIASVRTRDLGYWKIDAAHAVVIVGIEPERFFWIHDSSLAKGPVQVIWNGLLAGWVEYDYKGATIQR